MCIPWQINWWCISKVLWWLIVYLHFFESMSTTKVSSHITSPFRARRFRENNKDRPCSIVRTKKQRQDQRLKWKLEKRRYREKAKAQTKGQKHRRQKEWDRARKIVTKRVVKGKIIRKVPTNVLCKVLQKMMCRKNAKSKSDLRFRNQLIKQAICSLGCHRKTSTCLGVRRATIRKIACPLSKTANSAPTVEKVNFFYKRPDVSITLGGVRSVAKDGSIRRYLQQTIKDTYQRFRTEEPENNLSFSHFAKQLLQVKGKSYLGIQPAAMFPSV